MRSSILALGHWLAMRSSVWASHAIESTLFNLQVCRRMAMVKRSHPAELVTTFDTLPPLRPHCRPLFGNQLSMLDSCVLLPQGGTTVGAKQWLRYEWRL